MAKSQKDGFDNTDALISPHIDLPDVSDDIQQTLARLLGWDSNNQLFRLVTVDSNGALFGSIGPQKVTTFVVTAFTVGVAAVQLFISNGSRKSLLILNNSANAIFIGPTNGVTTATGFPLAPGASYSDDLNNGPIWAISAVAGNNVRTLEL